MEEAAPQSTSDWYVRNVLKSEPPTEEPQLAAYNLGIEVGKLLGAERVYKEKQAAEEEGAEEEAEGNTRVVILLVGREEPITLSSCKAQMFDGKLVVLDGNEDVIATFLINQVQGYYFD